MANHSLNLSPVGLENMVDACAHEPKILIEWRNGKEGIAAGPRPIGEGFLHLPLPLSVSFSPGHMYPLATKEKY